MRPFVSAAYGAIELKDAPSTAPPSTIEQGLVLEIEETGQAASSRSRDLNEPTQMPRETWRQRTLTSFKRLRKDTIDDLKTIRWLQILPYIHLHILPQALIAGLIYAVSLMASIPTISLSTSLCMPNGTPSSTNSYSPWKSSEFFTINVGFGSFSFELAKLIDVAWDLVIGRGGQAIMAFYSYRVLTSTLSRLMESRTVPFGVFEAVTLQQDTIKAQAKLIRDLPKLGDIRSRLTILNIVLVSAFILAFPTLASVITGYSADFDAEIRLNDGTIVPPTSLQKVWYIIHDGSRLGQGFYDEYPVVDTGVVEPSQYSYFSYNSKISNKGGNTLEEWELYRSSWMCNCSLFAPGTVNPTNHSVTLRPNLNFGNGSKCDLLWHVSRYTHDYGLLGKNNTDSIFYGIPNRDNMALKSPALNISMYMTVPTYYFYDALNEIFQNQGSAWAIIPYGVSWYMNSSKANNSRDMYGYRSWEYYHYYAPFTQELYAATNPEVNGVLSKVDIVNRVYCRQQGPGDQSPVRYQWGFAYLPLLLCFVLLLAWMINMYLLSVRNQISSRLEAHGRQMGLRRAVIDIAGQYEERLSGTDSTLKSDDELQKQFRNGTISYQYVAMRSARTGLMTGSERVGQWWKGYNFKRWVISERPWFIVFVVFTILFLYGIAGGLSYVVDPYFGVILWAGPVLVLMVGRAHPSRWILFAACTLLYLGLHLGLK